MNFKYSIPEPINSVMLPDGFYVRIRTGYTATVRKLSDLVEILQEKMTDETFGEITRESIDGEATEFRIIMIDIIEKFKLSLLN